jgi:hypothetical protein
LVIASSGTAFAGLYVAASVALGPLAPLQLPVWGMALGMALVGALVTLDAVDLRRALIEVVAAALLSGLLTWGLLALPGIVVPLYAVRLSNYGLTQAVLAMLLASLFGLVGVLLGTVINSGLRGLEV